MYNVPSEPERAAEAREARLSCESVKRLQYKIKLLVPPAGKVHMSLIDKITANHYQEMLYLCSNSIPWLNLLLKSK